MSYLKYGCVIFALWCACKSPTPVSFKKITDISLKISPAKEKNVSYYADTTGEYFVYYRADEKSVNFHRIDQNRVSHSFFLPVSLVRTLDETGKTRVSFFVHTPDSVFVMIDETNTIFLLKRDGSIIGQWTVDTELTNNNKVYVLMTMPQMPLVFKNNKIYVMNSRLDIVLNSPQNNIIYFSSVPDVSIEINDPIKIRNNTGKWPEIYKTGLAYHDYWPARCADEKGLLVYSFAVDNHLYIYRNNKLIKTVHARSKYFSEVHPFPKDSAGHFSFLKKYWVTEPRYYKIVFDPYRHLFYRIVRHGIKYEKEDDTVNSTQDKPWSVMILDTTFKLVDEVRFNPARYTPDIIPVKQGVLIPKRTDKSVDELTSLDYALYDISFQ